MSIVAELIRDATGSSVPVQELLRRLKVIAARTRTKDLADWVEHELTGYPSAEVTPAVSRTVRGPRARPTDRAVREGGHELPVTYWNTDAKPFEWTATPQEIIAKVAILQRDFRKLLANNSKQTILITRH